MRNISRDVQKSMRMAGFVKDAIIGVGGSIADGVHMQTDWLISYTNLPTLSIDEVKFVCDALKDYETLSEDARVIIFKLSDTKSDYDFYQSWSTEQCEAIMASVKMYNGMHVENSDNSHLYGQFFKIK